MDTPIHRTESSATTISLFLSKVYMWMSLGLIVTFGIALFMGDRLLNNDAFYDSVIPLLPIIFILEIIVVFALSLFANKMNVFLSGGLFIFYAILNGVFLSVVMVAYTETSVAMTFLATTGTFLVMSGYGFVTKQDLTTWGNIALMGLLGLIISSIINIFWANDAFSWFLTYVGIGIFLVLVAWDTQKLKEIGKAAEAQGVSVDRLAVTGALTLYLDFINLFIRLLRIFGKKR